MIHVTSLIPPVGTRPDSWPCCSWLSVWGQMIRMPCDLELGGEVILVDPTGLATWRTEVTDLVMYPFEHVRSGLDELRRRWGIDPIYHGPEIAPGVLVAWRARPMAYLGVAAPEATAIPTLVCAGCADGALKSWIQQLSSVSASTAVPTNPATSTDDADRQDDVS